LSATFIDHTAASKQFHAQTGFSTSKAVLISENIVGSHIVVAPSSLYVLLISGSANALRRLRRSRM
jgi:hypothetical protein